MTWIDRRRVAKLALVCSLSGSWCLEARAQAGTDAAAARALFTEARTLAERGRYDAACPKFEESLRLRPGSGTRFNLADCWEQLGRTASAWGQFLEVAAAAKSAGQKDREQLARRRAAALESKLSRLVIEVRGESQGVLVKRNGEVVGAGSFGTPVPVDPGQHTIEATAPGKRPWSRSVNVGGTEPVRIAVPTLESAPNAAAPSPVPVEKAEPAALRAADAPAIEAVTPALDDRKGISTQRTVSFVVAGLGVAALGAGTYFYLDFDYKNDEAKALCPTNVCDDEEIARHDKLIDAARGSRTLGYVGLGAGSAAVVTGVILYLTGGATKASTSGAWNVSPFVSQTASGIHAHAAW